MKLTGTFLDEITHDIPSQNWGINEWSRDFDAMKCIGIDTVILIRAGYKNRTTFKSNVLSKKIIPIEPQLDLLKLFLEESERVGMRLYFGTYDSGEYWINGQYEKETEINKSFCEEVITKYGHYKSFAGWYICHEINTYNDKMMKVYEDLSSHLVNLKKLPVLISPYIKGIKQFSKAISLDKHLLEWEKVFARLEGIVDIVAFQDGQISFEDLPYYLSANKKLADKHNIISWSNIESFDRDMPIKFPPIEFNKLIYKINKAQEAGVEKLITFEFSHFLSPNSIYKSARNLFHRYCEYINE